MSDDTPVPENLLEGLNSEQEAAVRILNGPLLVVAGPGSGKTRVLVQRIAALVATRTAAPERILAVTFTNKAAGEMKERLQQILPDGGADRLWVSTFHSLCARILRIEHEKAGLPRAYTILDSDDSASVIRRILSEMELPDSIKEAREYGKLISRVKNGGTTPNDRYLGAVYQAYETTLSRLGCVDFDDLLLKTARVLQDNPETRSRWSQRFSHVLVDEYQDTNPIQYELVRILSEKHRNICCVGDADQSIYGFRSASPEALLSFQADWPDSKIVYLGENYRCSGNILETAQAVIEGNPSPLRPQLRTANPPGHAVQLVICGDDRDEAAYIAEKCQAIRRTHPHETAAVLTRTRSLTRSLEEAMRNHGVPYTIVGALRFYDRAEVKDALSYLRFIANNNDELALRRMLTAPRRGLGDTAVNDLVETSRNQGVSLRDILRAPEEYLSGARFTDKWRKVDEQLTAIEQKARTNGPYGALDAVLRGGLLDHTRASGGDTAEDRIENLEELLAGANSFLSNPDPANPESGIVAQLPPMEQVEAFLSHVALLSGEEGDDADNGPVPILTAHSSKGKEFDHVYVCGLEEGIFPHKRSSNEASLEEERRLLFVACSRAKKTLSLTRAERRMTYKDIESNPPSRFISELPSSVETLHRSSSYSNGGATLASTTPWWAKARKEAGGRARTERISADQAEKGARVRHATFGEGTIQAVEPDNDTITVSFPDGIKILKRSAAPLTLVR